MKKRKIKLSEITKLLNLNVICGKDHLEKDIDGGYVSDLLSDVMANSKKNGIWITLQCHPNIVAVAALKWLSGIIIINVRTPEEETINKAENEKIPILTSELPAFELVGQLYELGISGLC